MKRQLRNLFIILLFLAPVIVLWGADTSEPTLLGEEGEWGVMSTCEPPDPHTLKLNVLKNGQEVASNAQIPITENVLQVRGHCGNTDHTVTVNTDGTPGQLQGAGDTGTHSVTYTAGHKTVTVSATGEHCSTVGSPRSFCVYDADAIQVELVGGSLNEGKLELQPLEEVQLTATVTIDGQPAPDKLVTFTIHGGLTAQELTKVTDAQGIAMIDAAAIDTVGEDYSFDANVDNGCGEDFESEKIYFDIIGCKIRTVIASCGHTDRGSVDLSSCNWTYEVVVGASQSDRVYLSVLPNDDRYCENHPDWGNWGTGTSVDGLVFNPEIPNVSVLILLANLVPVEYPVKLTTCEDEIDITVLAYPHLSRELEASKSIKEFLDKLKPVEEFFIRCLKVPYAKFKLDIEFAGTFKDAWKEEKGTCQAFYGADLTLALSGIAGAELNVPLKPPLFLTVGAEGKVYLSGTGTYRNGWSASGKGGLQGTVYVAVSLRVIIAEVEAGGKTSFGIEGEVKGEGDQIVFDSKLFWNPLTLYVKATVGRGWWKYTVANYEFQIFEEVERPLGKAILFPRP